MESRLWAGASNTTLSLIEDETANKVHKFEGTRVTLTTSYRLEAQVVAFVLREIILITDLEGLFETEIGLDSIATLVGANRIVHRIICHISSNFNERVAI